VSSSPCLFQSRAVTPELLWRISASELDPQPWRFKNHSLGLPHAPSLSGCLFLEHVSCVCAFFSTCMSICVARTACFEFCFIFNPTFFVLLLFFFVNYVTVPIDVHIALPICLSSSFLFIPISLVYAYVYVNLYMHFPTLTHSYTTITIFTCVYMMIIVSWPLIIWIYQLKYVSVYLLPETLCTCFQRCLHPFDLMFRGLFFNIHTCRCFLWIHKYHVNIQKGLILYVPSLPKCASFNHVLIRVYSINLKTCLCVNVYTKTVQSKLKMK